MHTENPFTERSINIIPFPDQAEREQRRKRRQPVASFIRMAPYQLPFNQAREWFEQEMDPLRPGISEKEKQEALQRDTLYLKNGFRMEERTGLLGFWEDGRSPSEARSLPGGPRNMSQVKGTQTYHLNGPHGFIVCFLTELEDGRMEIKERFYRKRT